MPAKKKKPTSEETAAVFAKRLDQTTTDGAEKVLDAISRARVAFAWEKCREYEGWMKAYDSLVLEPPDPEAKADQRSSFREIAEARQRETLSKEAEANTAAFEKTGVMPAWAWSDVKAARSIMRALVSPDYAAPVDPDQLGKHLFVLCVVLADLHWAKIPVSRVDSETLQFNLSRLVWAAGFGMATYSDLVPRMIATDKRRSPQLENKERKKAAIKKIENDHQGGERLSDRFVQRELDRMDREEGGGLSASIPTIAKYRKEIGEEGGKKK